MRVVLFNNLDCELVTWPSLQAFLTDCNNHHVDLQPGDWLQLEETETEKT